MTDTLSNKPASEKRNVKQVLVLRTRFEVVDDAGQPRLLTPRKGKLIAQGAHASLVAVLGVGSGVTGEQLVLGLDPDLRTWLDGGSKKIALGVETEDDLLRIFKAAQAAGLRTALIQDSGLTEFGGCPTYTAVAIGPNPSDRIDAITGSLKLL